REGTENLGKVLCHITISLKDSDKAEYIYEVNGRRLYVSVETVSARADGKLVPDSRYPELRDLKVSDLIAKTSWSEKKKPTGFDTGPGLITIMEKRDSPGVFKLLAIGCIGSMARTPTLRKETAGAAGCLIRALEDSTPGVGPMAAQALGDMGETAREATRAL